MRSTLVFLLVLGAHLAWADTIHLNTGVIVEGKVKQLPDGVISVTAGDSTTLYAKEEVQSIEENDRTGVLTEEEIQAQLAAEDAELTQKTGLTKEQRDEVLDLLYLLQRSEVAEHIKVRDKFLALQKQFDVYAFLSYMLPELSHRLAPNTLEVMYHLNAGKTLPLLRQEALDRYAGTRAMCLELLGEAGDAESVGLAVRGLADHTYEVKVAAIHALTRLGVKSATPALVSLLRSPDPRLANASKIALQTLWAEVLKDPPPKSNEEWMAVWNQQESSSNRGIELASIEPLIPAEHEFQNE